jgi:hypothetical protein
MKSITDRPKDSKLKTQGKENLKDLPMSELQAKLESSPDGLSQDEASFLTRTRGSFWSIVPTKILWIAVLGTQIMATLIAVYGLFMTPLGWGWALFV